mgnify:FL=1
MPADPAAQLAERFRRWLRDRHLPVTSQRDMVAQAVFASDSQLSVDDSAARLRDRGVNVGLATIYRALDTLVDAGFVQAHDFGEGFRRYETRKPGQPNGFLICARCGRVTEFPLDSLERGLALVADEHEFAAERSRVELHGICSACRRRDLGALARAGHGR